MKLCEGCKDASRCWAFQKCQHPGPGVPSRMIRSNTGLECDKEWESWVRGWNACIDQMEYNLRQVEGRSAPSAVECKHERQKWGITMRRGTCQDCGAELGEPRSTPSSERATLIHENDCPKIWDFWRKHALGSKLCPSCLACGQQAHDRADWWITHGELPDVYICNGCVEKLRAPASATAVIPASLDRLVEVHRGWCNYCQGNAEYCRTCPEGGCSLRDCLREMNLEERYR